MYYPLVPQVYSYYFQKKLSILNSLEQSSFYKFYPYQFNFLVDQSRFKCWLKSRQVGGSFTASLDLLLDSFLKGVPSVVLTAHSDILDSFRDQFDHHLHALFHLFPKLKKSVSFNKKLLLIPPLLPNGLLANYSIPIRFILSNPRTARGFNGSVLLDEFAFHQNPRSILYSVLPMVTRSHLFSLLVVSTPNTANDFFFRFVQKIYRNPSLFSLHKTTIYNAIDQGLNVDISLIRNFMENSEFRRAYLCDFMPSKSSIFNLQLLQSACVNFNADFVPLGKVFLGFDIGRKRDLSVLVLIEKIQNKLYLRKILPLKQVPFHRQLNIVKEWIQKYKVHFCVVDAGGMGLPISEALESLFPKKIISFSPSLLQKENLVFSIKWALIQKNLFLFKDQALFAEFLALSFNLFKLKVHSPFLSQFSSHCDRFWAFAYAFYASSLYLQDISQSDQFQDASTVARPVFWRDSFF